MDLTLLPEFLIRIDEIEKEGLTLVRKKNSALELFLRDNKEENDFTTAFNFDQLAFLLYNKRKIPFPGQTVGGWSRTSEGEFYVPGLKPGKI